VNDDLRLLRLEAVGEITALIHRYADRIDAGDFAAVGALFAHGRVTNAASPDTVATGAAGVQAMFEQWTRRYPDGTPRTKHLATNVEVQVDEAVASATAQTSFTVLQQTDTLPLQPIIAGRWVDEFERVDRSWRFTRRHMVTELHGDLRAHLLYAVPVDQGDSPNRSE
jgi:ketosteroid isomerase-like protein